MILSSVDFPQPDGPKFSHVHVQRDIADGDNLVGPVVGSPNALLTLHTVKIVVECF